MKIAVMTGLPAKWNMDIDACQHVYELMNNFIPNCFLCRAGKERR